LEGAPTKADSAWVTPRVLLASRSNSSRLLHPRLRDEVIGSGLSSVATKIVGRFARGTSVCTDYGAGISGIREWGPLGKEHKMDYGERTTGTRDEHYDLIAVLYHALHGADNCDHYALDAEAAGDERLAAFFREAQGAQMLLAERAKALLGISAPSSEADVPPVPEEQVVDAVVVDESPNEGTEGPSSTKDPPPPDGVR
jgi:hypothetical protein